MLNTRRYVKHKNNKGTKVFSLKLRKKPLRDRSEVFIIWLVLTHWGKTYTGKKFKLRFLTTM